LYEDGKFHGASINKGYSYEHKGQKFQLAGGSGILFYHNGDLERITVDCNSNEKIETNFIVDGKKLFLYRWEIITLYEKTGLPRIIRLRRTGSFQGRDYNLLEISETGEITDRVMEKRPNYDLD
jgi:hypothetical protein